MVHSLLVCELFRANIAGKNRAVKRLHGKSVYIFTQIHSCTTVWTALVSGGPLLDTGSTEQLRAFLALFGRLHHLHTNRAVEVLV